MEDVWKEYWPSSTVLGEPLDTALDWNETKITEDFLSSLPALDYILGSDIFYDPTVFELILKTVNIFFKKFPNLQFIFAYQNREANSSRWSIGIELKQLNLKCERLQISIEEEHEISIGKITTTTTTMASGDHKNVGERKKIYAGVEGGATHFSFIFIDADGNKLGEGTGLGLNILLEGIENASDKIAAALRHCATSSSIPLPIDSLGLGLSGAEDEEVNNSMIEYFKTKHSDICTIIHLTTDSVISIAATFNKGGVVIIAGTGSTCRLLKEDGDVYGKLFEYYLMLKMVTQK
uniref:N-acetylglucosamine kinase n=1 Tax=Panagrolaimus superbus TaxID=310955 RepID=A0A914XSV2_9BILA